MMASAPSGRSYTNAASHWTTTRSSGKIRERDAQRFVLLTRLERLNLKEQQLCEIAREAVGELIRVDLRLEAGNVEDEVVFDEHFVRLDQGGSNFREDVFERRSSEGFKAAVAAKSPPEVGETSPFAFIPHADPDRDHAEVEDLCANAGLVFFQVGEAHDKRRYGILNELGTRLTPKLKRRARHTGSANGLQQTQVDGIRHIVDKKCAKCCLADSR